MHGDARPMGIHFPNTLTLFLSLCFIFGFLLKNKIFSIVYYKNIYYFVVFNWHSIKLIFNVWVFCINTIYPWHTHIQIHKSVYIFTRYIFFSFTLILLFFFFFFLGIFRTVPNNFITSESFLKWLCFTFVLLFSRVLRNLVQFSVNRMVPFFVKLLFIFTVLQKQKDTFVNNDITSVISSFIDMCKVKNTWRY